MHNKEKPQTKAVVKKEKKDLMWLGSQTLMGAVTPGSKEAKERQIIKMVATVLNVSPYGVNLLGGLPYINKLGLVQKSKQYGKGKDEFKYNWIQRATDETMKAIVECKIVRDGKDVTDWVTGECSPKTMKMGTLTGYQNHMAQTRARNRAILEAYSVEIHEEMIENIGKALAQKHISEKQAEALVETAGRATSASNEEVELDKKQKSEAVNPSLFAYPSGKESPVRSGDPHLECHGCAAVITPQVADYSKRMFKKQLCRNCQREARPAKR